MIPTDNLRTLSERTGVYTVSDLRAMARDAGLEVHYNGIKRAWCIYETASITRDFNEQVMSLSDDLVERAEAINRHARERVTETDETAPVRQDEDPQPHE